MRLRILLVALLMLSIAFGLLNFDILMDYFTEQSTTTPRPRSKALAVLFLGCTNGNACIEVRNQTHSKVWFCSAEVEVRTNQYDSDYRVEGGYTLTNLTALFPGDCFRGCFPAPTNHQTWRVVVPGCGSWDIGLAKLIRSSGWLSKHFKPRMQPVFCQSDWITP
jgi:hypothetical protein